MGNLKIYQSLNGTVDLPDDLSDSGVWRCTQPFPGHLIHVTLGQLSPLWTDVQTCVQVVLVSRFWIPDYGFWFLADFIQCLKRTCVESASNKCFKYFKPLIAVTDI